MAKKKPPTTTTVAPNGAPVDAHGNIDPRVERMSLDDALAIAHKKNPKEHDVGELVASFQRFGFVATPTIDEATGVMVAGHGRCLALKRMRDESLPAPRGIVVADGRWMVPILRGVWFDNENERDAYLIADNQHTIHGGWNMDLLTEGLEQLRAQGASFDGLGFEPIELSTFGFGTRSDPRGDDDEDTSTKTDGDKPDIVQDDIPDPPRVPVTKPGDVWRLGDHLVICADCTAVDAARLRIKRSQNDLGFGLTSPPYNGGKSLTSGPRRGMSRYEDSDDELDSDEYAALLDASTRLLLRSTDVAVVNLQSLAGNKRIVVRWLARFVDHLSDRAVWSKTQAAPAISPRVMNSRFEDLYVFSSEKKPKRSIPTADFHGTVHNVVEGPSAVHDNDHADVHAGTMPVHLASWAIDNLGKRAAYVVDPFGGTGTTLVVAEQLGKRAALVELSPSYVDVIVERWEKLTGGKAARE